MTGLPTQETRLAVRRLFHHSEAEDLVNETFFIFYRKAKAGAFHKADNLRALLFGILRFEIKAQLRKQAKALPSPALQENEHIDPWPTLEARPTTPSCAKSQTAEIEGNTIAILACRAANPNYFGISNMAV